MIRKAHRAKVLGAPLLLATALVSFSCSPGSAARGSKEPRAVSEITDAGPEEAIVLVDDLGREVRLAQRAARIVSLAPAHTETLFALCAGPQLVGRDDFSDYPPEALRVPSIGSTHPKLNAEVVVLLEPELVLAAGTTNPDDVYGLARLGLTVYATGAARNLEDIYSNIVALGHLSGRIGEAAGLVAALKDGAEDIRRRVARVRMRPEVFYELDATDPAKPWTAGPGSFIAELIDLAGGHNVGDSGREQYFQVSLEELVARDPKVVILGSAIYGRETPELLKARQGWGSISAVKSGAIYPFDDNLVSRPGPRVVLGLETLAKLIHPELFP